MGQDQGTLSPAPMDPGTKVDVRNTLDGSWTHGFEIVEVVGDGYRVRRSSDQRVLPRPLSTADVRREHRSSMWWI